MLLAPRIALFGVTEEWCAVIGHLYADLMTSASMKVNFNQTKIFGPGDHFIIKNCLLCSGCSRLCNTNQIQSGILNEIIVKTAFCILRTTLNYTKIGLPHFMPADLFRQS